MQQGAILFDHLIGQGEQLCGNIDAECSNCLEIDHQFEPRWLNDWQVRRLLALEDARHVQAGLTIPFREAVPVADQATGDCEFSKWIDRWHRMTRCQNDDLLTHAHQKRVGANEKCGCALGDHRLESRVYLSRRASLHDGELPRGGTLRLTQLFHLCIEIWI